MSSYVPLADVMRSLCLYSAVMPFLLVMRKHVAIFFMLISRSSLFHLVYKHTRHILGNAHNIYDVSAQNIIVYTTCGQVA